MSDTDFGPSVCPCEACACTRTLVCIGCKCDVCGCKG